MLSSSTGSSGAVGSELEKELDSNGLIFLKKARTDRSSSESRLPKVGKSVCGAKLKFAPFGFL